MSEGDIFNLTEAIASNAAIDYERLEGMLATAYHPVFGHLSYRLTKTDDDPSKQSSWYTTRECPVGINYAWNHAFTEAWYGRRGWTLFIHGEVPIKEDQMETLKYKRARNIEPFYAPERAHDGDAGLDLRFNPGVPVEHTLKAGERRLFSTGISIELPSNMVAYVCSRSGLALRSGVVVTNAPGVIDSGYSGEIGVILTNTGDRDVTFKPGDRIAQLVIQDAYKPIPVEVSEAQEGSARGDAGFGSTGME